jgi:hypothetical protein
MTLDRLDGANPVKAQRWWRRPLPHWAMKDRASLWVWSSVALSLLSFACSLLGFNSATIAFAALLAISLAVISLSRRPGEHAHQAVYLAEAQKLSQTGSFGWNVATGELFWSDETFRIFDLVPTSRPSLGLVLKRTHPDDVSAVREAIDRAVNERGNFSHENRLMLEDGTVRTIRVVARGMTNGRGRAERSFQNEAEFRNCTRSNRAGQPHWPCISAKTAPFAEAETATAN